MSVFKQLLRVLALLLGGLGVAACCFAIFGVWFVDQRVAETTVALSEQLDKSLVRVHEGVRQATDRLNSSKLRAETVKQALENWSTLEATEQLRQRLNFDERAEQLSNVLENADAWLQSASASVGVIQQTIELANTAGSDIQTDKVNVLLEELVELQSKVQVVNQMVADFLPQPGGLPPDLDDYMERAKQLALRILASLDIVQMRLAEFDAKVEGAQLYIQKVESNTLSWIHLIAIIVAAFIAWMLAGQFALFRSGWASRQQSSG